MRILHTGDWHVGKTIRGRSRADEHQAVLNEIQEIASARQVELALVAGDLFDTAAPTAESEEIVYRALLGLSTAAGHLVVISGNHDNQRRLGAVKPLLELTNVHVAPDVARPQEGGVLALQTAKGETANIAMLPFVSQRGIIKADALMAQDADDHAMAYAERLAHIIALLCAEAASGAVNLLLAHGMVHGGKMGGGERDAHTVFEYSIPTTAFPAHLHYVALGHLHRAQALPAPCPVHYCGSPLQLDFGEVDDTKSITIIEAYAGKPARIEEVALTAGRHLRTVRGTIEQLKARSEEFGDDYLRVELDEKPAAGLSDEVRGLFRNAVDVRVTQHETQPGRLKDRTAAMGRSPIELFGMYLQEQSAENDDVIALFKELLEEHHAAQAD